MDAKLFVFDISSRKYDNLYYGKKIEVAALSYKDAKKRALEKCKKMLIEAAKENNTFVCWNNKDAKAELLFIGIF